MPAFDAEAFVHWERLSLIPVIPFSVKMRRIRETVETITAVTNSLASRINTG
jgi:hypothetical protein